MLAGNLMAVAFDAERLQTTGPAVPAIEGIRGRATTSEVGFAVSRTGFVVYAPGATTTAAMRTLAWVDRQGREEPVPAPPRAYALLRVSPDGRRAALDLRDQENDIWVWDFKRQTLTRLTSHPGIDMQPVWTPDGKRIVYTSDRLGTRANSLFWQAADGSGEAEQLSQSANACLAAQLVLAGRQTARVSRGVFEYRS